MDDNLTIIVEKDLDQWMAFSPDTKSYGTGKFPLEAVRRFIEAVEDRSSSLLRADYANLGEDLQAECDQLEFWFEVLDA